MSHIKLDKRGSDCGTKRTITVELNDTNIKLMMYSYIVEGSRLIRLDSTTIDKYRGKTVKMRFSSMCRHEHICNKCAGDLYYILGIENIGTAAPQLASTVKNVCMSAFHNSTEHFIQMNAMDAFGE